MPQNEHWHSRALRKRQFLIMNPLGYDFRLDFHKLRKRLSQPLMPQAEVCDFCSLKICLQSRKRLKETQGKIEEMGLLKMGKI